jgi:murein DD-endopeptidase MepM/ murein hydrolase activator NlpD
VLDLGDGAYAAVAHLRQGSVLVRPGQRVSAGAELAECGNSGNSTEPHVHFQLMDHPRPAFAAGLPFRFTHTDTRDGLSKNEEPFVANTVNVR